MFRPNYLCCLRNSVSLMLEIRGSRHAVRAFNRSVALSKASASVIMSSELDIRNYFEFAKELTLKAGEVSPTIISSFCWNSIGLTKRRMVDSHRVFFLLWISFKEERKTVILLLRNRINFVVNLEFSLEFSYLLSYLDIIESILKLFIYQKD